jgi:hypothetical protein
MLFGSFFPFLILDETERRSNNTVSAILGSGRREEVIPLPQTNWPSLNRVIWPYLDNGSL